MFVMNFVRTSQPFCVPIINISKILKPLMNKNIMHNKISRAICHNSQAYGKSRPKALVTPKVKAGHTHNGIENKKGVIAFKLAFVVFVMVVFVQAP